MRFSIRSAAVLTLFAAAVGSLPYAGSAEPAATQPDTRDAAADPKMESWTSVINDPNAAAVQKARARMERGALLERRGKNDEALADFSAVIDGPVDRPAIKAAAHFRRGWLYLTMGGSDKCVADCTVVIETPDAPPALKAEARHVRGLAHYELGQIAKALADYTAAIDDPDFKHYSKLSALLSRARALARLPDFEKAIADYTTVLEDQEATMWQRSMAHVNRGVCHTRRGETDKAIADYTAVVDDPDARASDRIMALRNRASAYLRGGDVSKGCKDFGEAARLNPEAGDLFNRWVECLIASGRHREAAPAYAFSRPNAFAKPRDMVIRLHLEAIALSLDGKDASQALSRIDVLLKQGVSLRGCRLSVLSIFFKKAQASAYPQGALDRAREIYESFNQARDKQQPSPTTQGENGAIEF